MVHKFHTDLATSDHKSSSPLKVREIECSRIKDRDTSRTFLRVSKRYLMASDHSSSLCVVVPDLVVLSRWVKIYYSRIMLLESCMCFANAERKKVADIWFIVSKTLELTNGQFYVLLDNLREDREKFYNYFRTSPNSFDELLTLLTPHKYQA